VCSSQPSTQRCREYLYGALGGGAPADDGQQQILCRAAQRNVSLAVVVRPRDAGLFVARDGPLTAGTEAVVGGVQVQCATRLNGNGCDRASMLTRSIHSLIPSAASSGDRS